MKPQAPPPSKLSILVLHLQMGRDREALKLAASFPRLGDEKEAITRGWAAMKNPDFYCGLGNDPDELIREGVAALRSKYLDRVKDPKLASGI